MPVSLQDSNETATKFSEDELGAFLEACEELELDPISNDDDEYIAHHPDTGLMCAYFCQSAPRGPSGGWIHM